jgi:Protein of unknown function (DUF2630)
MEAHGHVSGEEDLSDRVGGRNSLPEPLEDSVMNEPTKEGSDQTVLSHIERLVAEEHRLYNQGAGNTDAEVARLKNIQVELDQCWDLTTPASRPA